MQEWVTDFIDIAVTNVTGCEPHIVGEDRMGYTYVWQ